MATCDVKWHSWVGTGTADMERQGWSNNGQAGCGAVRRGRLGWDRQGRTRHGPMGSGEVRQAGHDTSGLVPLDLGWMRYGVADVARCGLVP